MNPLSTDCPAQAAAVSKLAREQQHAKGEVYANCCIDAHTQPFYSPLIQERAWTSPIWYRPGTPDAFTKIKDK